MLCGVRTCVAGRRGVDRTPNSSLSYPGYPPPPSQLRAGQEALARFRISVSASHGLATGPRARVERGGQARPRSGPAVGGGGGEGGEVAARREGKRVSRRTSSWNLLRAAYYARPLRSVPPYLTDVKVRVGGQGQGQGQG